MEGAELYTSPSHEQSINQSLSSPTVPTISFNLPIAPTPNATAAADNSLTTMDGICIPVKDVAVEPKDLVCICNLFVTCCQLTSNHLPFFSHRKRGPQFPTKRGSMVETSLCLVTTKEERQKKHQSLPLRLILFALLPEICSMIRPCMPHLQCISLSL
jgi:hypothetical protein